MKKNLLISLTVLIVAVLTLTGCGMKDKADLPDDGTAEPDTVFAGSYNVKGPDYTAALSITQTGDCYHLMWVFGDGSLVYGKGLIKDDVMGVTFGTEEGMDVGTMLYKKDGKGGISGLWVVAGDGHIFNERTKGASVLKPSSHKLEGTYDVEGTNPDGSTYTAILDITATGKSYYALWTFGEGTVEGEGITIGDLFVTGFGTTEFSGVLIYEITGDKLVGNWVSTDNASFSSTIPLLVGKEKAVKQ